eukprot:gnl/TRDRNA2_/TRDRNA2_92668_c0_seq1.p1 gnl/TRDRNA2_/TRDRNA2_92668_c0~~gnl/TRDRNA2_/TRDRNA2_92668_c0_seq1.p1  ORF type:complete len:254 (+),score=44.76 gnl/TRDRNA2_/TRDRNA2_92668_c0_seq1:135-896(+)
MKNSQKTKCIMKTTMKKPSAANKKVAKQVTASSKKTKHVAGTPPTGALKKKVAEITNNKTSFGKFSELVKKLSKKEVNKHIGQTQWLRDLVYNEGEDSPGKLDSLLQAGLNPDTKGLLLESVYGQGECMRLLLEYGANPAGEVNKRADGWRCPFVAAAEEGNPGWKLQTMQLKYALFCKFGVQGGQKEWKAALQRVRRDWRQEGQPKDWVQYRLKEFEKFRYGWMMGWDRLMAKEPPEITRQWGREASEIDDL